MGFEFRIKTGFFETKPFDLLIGKGKLILSPTEPEDQVIIIKEEDILSITLKNVKSLEIEIQTWDKLYQGVLSRKVDYEKLLGELKENINKKIICEYEANMREEGSLKRVDLRTNPKKGAQNQAVLWRRQKSSRTKTETVPNTPAVGG